MIKCTQQWRRLIGEDLGGITCEIRLKHPKTPRVPSFAENGDEKQHAYLKPDVKQMHIKYAYDLDTPVSPHLDALPPSPLPPPRSALPRLGSLSPLPPG